MGNTKWCTKLQDDDASYLIPLKLLLNNSGELYLTTLVRYSNSSTYKTYKFTNYERSFDVVTNNLNEPLHLSEELIIKFKADITNNLFIDNRDLQYDIIGNVINDITAIQDIEEQLSVTNLKDWKIIKIFQNLTTSDTISTTRLGKTTRTPDFFNMFILEVSKKSSSESLQNILDHLNSDNLDCYIEYAEFNDILSLDCPPNDVLYT